MGPAESAPGADITHSGLDLITPGSAAASAHGPPQHPDLFLFSQIGRLTVSRTAKPLMHAVRTRRTP